MFFQAFKNESLKKWIAYYSLICFFFTFQASSQVPVSPDADSYPDSYPDSYSYPNSNSCSDPGSCFLKDRDAARRTRVAKIVAGATIIALVGGVAYAVLGSSRSCHKHSHSCHSYSYCNSPRHDHSQHHNNHNNHNNNNHNNHNNHHSNHDHCSSSPWYSDYSPSRYYSSNPYSIFSENNVSNFSGSNSQVLMDPQRFQRGDLFIRAKHLARSQSKSESSKEASELSGAFILHPVTGLHQGNAAVFVRLPDGSTQTLGNATFSCKSSSIPYGPFTQKGTYAFGINVEGSPSLSSQVKIGSIEVNVNDSTVETHDFYIPPHCPAHYEPSPCEYTLD